ncbi:hypothetical protein [Mesobacillus harenae]|uniref:hypothetical protein n=1 Tax=Mesobacillus harenae TaxID=2213203 RepID=UPI001580F0A6|nr:hypothetical protein [Mesobacillus harenae]
MKRYLVFIACFLLLHTAFQLLLGLWLTAAYIPDFSALEQSSKQEVVFGENSWGSSFFMFVAATIAYFISHLSLKTAKNG